MMHTGHCHCGRIRFVFDGEPSGASFCHCSICRRMTGSAFGAWCEVPYRNFRWLKGRDQVSKYAVTDRLGTLFCRTCGVVVLAEHRDWPGFRYIALGALDGDVEIVPEYHQFTACKAPWYRIHDPIPQYESWPEDEASSCGWGAVAARNVHA